MIRMRALLYTIFLLGNTVVLCGDLPDEFENLLKNANLVFNEPSEISLALLAADTLMNNDIRYYSSENNIEMRIDIILIDSSERYDNPNIFKIAKSGTYEDMSLVTKPFNSDLAAIAEFDLQTGYLDNKYKHCGILWLHKNETAGVYICLLGDDKTKLLKFFRNQVCDLKNPILKFK